MKNGDLCPACINGNLTGKKLDLPWKFGKKHKTIFKDAVVFSCENCSESFFDEETNTRIFEWVEEKINERMGQ